MQRRCHSLAAREDGFTLIEVLVTALIVGLLASATATALVSTNHTSGDQRMRSQADALATQDQERLRGLSDEQLSALTGPGAQSRSATLQVDGQTKQFTVVSDASYQAVNAKVSCSDGSAAYFRITSKVSWSEGGQAPTITEESLVSRSPTGQLLTIAHDETGGPLSGVTVSTSGPATRSDLTDANGCMVFAGLPAGAYGVTVSRPGYVDVDGHPTQSGTAVIHDADATVATTTGNPFKLGLAGALRATLKTSVANVGGEADAITYSGSGSGLSMTSAGMVTSSSVQSSFLTPHTLFPFDSATATSNPPTYVGNYTVWAGPCAGQAPKSPVHLTVTPGAVPDAAGQSLVEPLLNLSSFKATTPNGVASTAPSHVLLTFASGGCTDSWRPTIIQSSSQTPPATGWLASPGQPYAAAGTLTVCADYGSAGSYVRGSVTTGNVSTTAANMVPPIVANQPGSC